MPVWPKSFYTFAVNMKTAGTEWKLRHRRYSVQRQEQTFARLLPQLSAATHWKQAGMTPKMSYAEFKNRVPLQTYSRLMPAIERMQAGEPDVLWPGRCALFARSSGTTTGQRKLLPVTEEMLAHFRRAGRDALLYYTVRVKNAGAFRGRHLLLGGSAELTPLATQDAVVADGNVYLGELSGIVAVNLPTWAERHLYEPGTAIACVPDWDERLDAIVARTCRLDISLLAAIPTWVIPFVERMQEACAQSGQRLVQMQQVWPNLECLVHTGVSLAPYERQLRTMLGPYVKFHEVFAASEAFIAAQDLDGAKGLRLMTDVGIFFEFLPMTEFDEHRLEQLGAKAVPLAQVKAGIDYALVLTTPGGLARYVLGDVVRFTSVEPPRLVYIGSTTLRLNAFGENVTEKEVTDALVLVCHKHDWVLVNFHVSVLPGGTTLTGQNRGRHEWWVELKPGTIETPTGPQIATELDAELQRVNVDYAARRRSGSIDMPFVRLVMPGVFKHWLRHEGRWGGQNKLSRCRVDRSIADPLAKLTHFARD